MRVWHRYIQVRARGRAPGRALDAGIGLVELLVAIILIAIALLGVAGEVAANLTQQALENSQATALHIADQWLEKAQVAAQSNACFAATGQTKDAAGATTSCTASAFGTTTLASLVSTTRSAPTTTVNNLVYTLTVSDPQLCAYDAEHPPPACATPTSPIDYTKVAQYATVTVSWRLSSRPHHITLTRNLTAAGAASDVGENESPLSNCPTDPDDDPTTSVEGTLTITPANSASSRMNMAGSTFNPSSNVVATLSGVKGLAWKKINGDESESTTCIELEYHDDRGNHYVALHAAPNADPTKLPTIWSATIPAANILASPTPASYYQSCVPFRADGLGKAGLPWLNPWPTACGDDGQANGDGTLYLQVPPPTLDCSVSSLNAVTEALSAVIPQSALQGLLTGLFALLGLTKVGDLLNNLTTITLPTGVTQLISKGHILPTGNLIIPPLLSTGFICNVTHLDEGAPGDTVKVTYPTCATNNPPLSPQPLTPTTSAKVVWSWTLAPNNCTSNPLPPKGTYSTGLLGSVLNPVLTLSATTLNMTFTLTRTNYTGSVTQTVPVVVL